MVLKPEPFFECIERLLKKRETTIILFSLPQKEKYLIRKQLITFSSSENILIVAGHYKEIDDRVRERFATDEISIGNFILTGGEFRR